MSQAQAIYVIRGQDRVKIGISNAPSVRLKTVLPGAKTDRALAYSAFLGDGNARKLEQRAHEILSHKSLGREWFSASIDEAVGAVIQAAKELGFSLSSHDEEEERAVVFLRFSQETKDALKRAAEDDFGRSSAAMAEKILIEWLREHGYLPKPKRAVTTRTAR